MVEHLIFKEHFSEVNQSFSAHFVFFTGVDIKPLTLQSDISQLNHTRAVAHVQILTKLVQHG